MNTLNCGMCMFFFYKIREPGKYSKVYKNIQRILVKLTLIVVGRVYKKLNINTIKKNEESFIRISKGPN